MLEWFFVYVVIIIGACLQNVVGFGLGMLCAPVLMHIFPDLIPVPMIFNALVLTGVISFKHRQAMDFKHSVVSMLGGTFGILIASSIMVFVSGNTYKVLFGLSIIIATLLSKIGFVPKINYRTNVIAGMVSGFMGTLTSAGGAPMGLLYQSERQDKIKANLNAFFLYINVMAIVALWFGGLVGKRELELFMYCVPALIVGWSLSGLVNKYVNPKVIQQLVLFVAFAAGLLLVIPFGST